MAGLTGDRPQGESVRGAEFLFYHLRDAAEADTVLSQTGPEVT